jgi:predicted alpha/beta-hydrolase family hydrolase
VTGGDRPDRSGPAEPLAGFGVLLAPGAGAGRDQAGLVALDSELVRLGARVERMDFAYRIAGRRAPDRLPVLVSAVATAGRTLGRSCDRLVIGGRSMGGRVCSVAAAGGVDLGPAVLDAVVLVSYPLHPPGRPDRLRDDHFPGLRVPCLFVSGTRDAFGTPAELRAASERIPAPVTHHWIDGADHALRNREHEVAAVVGAWLASTLPDTTLPDTTLPATTLPATTLPARTRATTTSPATASPAVAPPIGPGAR